MKPYYERHGIALYHGDCRDIAPALAYDCICSDPPWGSDTACDNKRFTASHSPWWDVVDRSKCAERAKIVGDDKPFDPSPWIDRPSILWGAPHFASRLPDSGGWLIWDKRRGAETMAENGWPLGEAELAWTNLMGATRVYRNLWSGLLRSSEKGEFYHPTQKPVRLMEWCIGFLPAGVVLDPFAGSGSLLVAAASLQRAAIGIEIEERYCEVIARRLGSVTLALPVA
jgi:site-specific DNA-methyltransferase (adenine-specific)